ncbi:MAG: type II toxin-antitoxin system PemK/MazF family toxin [Bacillota bacterium]|nr:type II toxin-antitoxin system PemK/MazF family toxin [Bacillota bacterium]
MSVILVRRGDIFYADLPEAQVGSAQTGRRPVIITQSNWLNRSSPTVIIACLTSQIKNPDMECHYVLPLLKGLPLRTMVLGEQRHTIDKSLLIEYRCHIRRRLMRKVTKALRAAEREDYGDKPKRQWKKKKRK